jgi:hypothetical protein
MSMSDEHTVVVKHVGIAAARVTTQRAVVPPDNVIGPFDYRGRVDAIAYIIGGTPTSCLDFRDESRGIHIKAWCDDDGIRRRLPVNFSRPTDGADIRGTVVFTGIGIVDGERDWRGLTKQEIDEVFALIDALIPPGGAI